MTVKFLGQQNKDNWECFAWEATIKGVTFNYYTGLGHAIKNEYWVGLKPKSTLKYKNLFVYIPKFRDLVHSLALDAHCAQDSFEDFCANMGYDSDSRKALETYLTCQENGHKLRKMGYDMNRILAWEL